MGLNPAAHKLAMSYTTACRIYQPNAVFLMINAYLQIPVYIRGGTIFATKERVRRASSLTEHDPYTIYVALDYPVGFSVLVVYWGITWSRYSQGSTPKFSDQEILNILPHALCRKFRVQFFSC